MQMFWYFLEFGIFDSYNNVDVTIGQTFISKLSSSIRHCGQKPEYEAGDTTEKILSDVLHWSYK